jgi:hypothetical protein
VLLAWCVTRPGMPFVPSVVNGHVASCCWRNQRTTSSG